jgi:hypothetical protein
VRTERGETAEPRSALPNEKPAGRRVCEAGATGLEPATSGVTGRRSNQLNYAPKAVRHEGLTFTIIAKAPGRRQTPDQSEDVLGLDELPELEELPLSDLAGVDDPESPLLDESLDLLSPPLLEGAFLPL